MIIDNISRNGILVEQDLYETPFTYIHDFGIEGVFEKEEREELVEIVQVVNQVTVFA